MVNATPSPFDLTGTQKERLAAALQGYQEENPTSRPVQPPMTHQERMKRYQASLVSGIHKDKAVSDKVEQEKVHQRLEFWKSRIDTRWHDATLDSPTLFPEVRRIINSKLKRWESGTGLDQTSLLFAGIYGRGKTWSAYAYAAELIRLGYLSASQIYICTEVEIAAIATSGFQKSQGLANLMDPKYKFFLVDDVGRGSFGAPQQRGEIWFTIINHVYSKGLTLALTTNQTVQKTSDGNSPMEDWIGAASMERLRSIVGQDGYLAFTQSMVNMREELARRSQERFKNYQDASSDR